MKDFLLALITLSGLFTTIHLIIAEQKVRRLEDGGRYTLRERFILEVRKPFYKVLSAVISSLLIIGLSIKRDNIIDIENSLNISQRDSINREENRRDKQSTEQNIGEILAKYKLRVDSQKLEIVKLINDSTKTKSIVITSNIPKLTIQGSMNSIRNGLDTIFLALEVRGNNTERIDIHTVVLANDGVKISFVEENDLFVITRGLAMQENGVATIATKSKAGTIMEYVFQFKGYYLDQNGKKRKLEEYWVFKTKHPQNWMPIPEKDLSSVRSHFKDLINP